MLTDAQIRHISDFINSITLSRGGGTEESACSIAAINLALYGKLTDDIPSCMSPVIGRWIIRIQDAMPLELRNDPKWKSLLPLAAGTGQDSHKEQARRKIIIEWMWVSVLPQLQVVADNRGFGEQWMNMCQGKTSADAASSATAYVATAYVATAYAHAADAAHAAATASAASSAYAADAAAASSAYAYAADAADAADAAAAAAAATAAASSSAYAAAAAAAAAATAAAAAAATVELSAFWKRADPIGLLKTLVTI